jgi:hypothetical protein
MIAVDRVPVDHYRHVFLGDAPRRNVRNVLIPKMLPAAPGELLENALTQPRSIVQLDAFRRAQS